ncbi:MAG: BACON domain-containing protein [Algoriphagus aquaeductus]|uniref:BACON domain-containing protein n=1 Tax=Algoriphagus aquaeductus TaxID=475299 RepID=UPI0039199992
MNEGKICFEKGDYACAINKYEDAFNSITGRDKQIAEINLSRAKLCLKWLNEANSAFSQKNFSVAKELYQNILNENPKDEFAQIRLEECKKASTYLRISKNSLTFTSSGVAQTINIQTDATSYTIENKPSWVVITKNEGYISVSCNVNQDEKNRSGSIIIKAGNQTNTISINQLGKSPEVVFSISNQNIVLESPAAETVLIDIKTNDENYQITGLPYWITFGKKYPTWFSLYFQENKNTVSRKSAFKVVAEGKEIIVNAYQPSRDRIGNSSANQNSTTYKKSQSLKTRCFNCPKTKDSWGITLGHSNLIFDPLNQKPLQGINYRNGFQFGLRFDPLFKGGFGLNTGVFLTGYSNIISSNSSSNFEIDRLEFSIPLHLEYRLNFSKWFNIFAYAGPRFNSFSQPANNQTVQPATVDYGAGLRINRIQFNFGKSLNVGDFREFSNIGRKTSTYQNLLITMSYMF